MPQRGKLILRKTTSPYTGDYADTNAGRTLSSSELDNNFINLKGELVYTAATSGNDLIITLLNGQTISADLSMIAPTGGTTDIFALSGLSGNSIVDIIGNHTLAEDSSNALEFNFLAGGQNNIMTGGSTTWATMIGGKNNLMIDGGNDESVIIGGEGNTMFNGTQGSVIAAGTGNYMEIADDSMIGSGIRNTITSGPSFIGSGMDNATLGSQYTGLIAGRDNTISGTSVYSFIGSGRENNVINGSTYTAVIGGYQNNLDNADFTAILAARATEISANYSVIGGYGHTATTNANGSAVFGGYRDDGKGAFFFPNYIDIESGFVAGFDNHVVGAAGNFAIGKSNEIYGGIGAGAVGSEHVVSGSSAFAAGQSSTVDGVAAIGLGSNVVTDANYAMAVNEATYASGQASFAGGRGAGTSTPTRASGVGAFNFSYTTLATLSGASANFSAILGGENQNILSTDTHSVIIGGQSHIISGGTNNGGIFGGNNNEIVGSDNAIIAGGNNNTVTGVESTGGIFGAQSSTLALDIYGVIIGGQNQTISGSSPSTATAIIGGQQHDIIDAPLSIIGGGSENYIYGVSYAGIYAGQNNTITGETDGASHEFIGGGFNNDILRASRATIIGGTNNVIESFEGAPTDYAYDSAIIGGDGNIVRTFGSAIVAGFDSAITGAGNSLSVVVGGGSHLIESNSSGIIAGQDGTINNDYSFIGGGQNNTINGSVSTIIGGQSSTINSNNSAVIAGQNNAISGDSTHSVIVGGYLNTILSAVTRSVILGGTNITASTNDTVYTPNLEVTGQANSPFYDNLSGATSFVPDWNQGNFQKIALSGTTNVSGGTTTMKDGATYTLMVTQSNGGSKLINWDSTYKWEGGTPPTLTTADGAVDIITFVCDGTSLYGLIAKNFS